MKKTVKSKKPREDRRRRQSEFIADWDAADAVLLRSVISTVTKDDGAVRFGYSRDGGAFAIGIYGDGETFTEYLGAKEDVNVWLEGIRLDYE